LRLRPLFATMIIAAIFCFCGTARASEIQAELSRSLKGAPSSDAMGADRGFVMLRDISYRLLSDGRMERKTLWFLHEGGGIPDSWRNWEIVIPEGGEASVVEAALYSPSTAKVQFPLIPRETAREGVPLIAVRLPNSFEGGILVLCYRQVFPTRMNIEDSVLIDLDLPQWEQRISLNVPSGTVPEWEGEGIPDPDLKKGGAQDIYTWSIINTGPRPEGVIAQDPVRALVFSLQKGLRYSISAADAMAASVDQPPPPHVASMLSDPNRIRGGERVIAYMNDPSRIISGLPSGFVRPPAAIPSDGPWTEWEASFLLSSWLKSAGWGSAILWDGLTSLKDASPATVSSWKKPVLSLTPPGGKAFLFEIGQGIRPGNMPPRLWGRTLYALEGSTPLRRPTPAGGAADHRLSFSWNLDLAPDGVATGELVVNVRGAWMDVLSGGSVPSGKEARVLLSSFGWPATPGILDDELSTEMIGTGFRVAVPVRTQLGIPGGNGLLARMPSVVMPWQTAIAERGAPGGIRFPFAFEQSIEISLPEGFDVMVLPALRPFGSGNVRTEESMRVKKSRVLVGEQKMVVTSAKLDDAAREILSNAVRQGLGWSGITIPLRRR